MRPMPKFKVEVLDVVSDIHFGVGSENLAAVDAYAQFAAVHPPHTRVWLGDVAEMESCSSHGGAREPPTLGQDLDATRAGIQRMLSWDETPIRNVWVPGNHEDRYARRLTSDVPELANALPPLETLLGLDGWGFEMPGNVWGHRGGIFTHGWVRSQHHGAVMLQKFPDARFVVYGHHHTTAATWRKRSNYGAPTPVTPCSRAKAGRIAIANPCLRDLDPTWVRGPSGWVNGFTRFWFWDAGFQHKTFWMHGPLCEFFAEGDLWHSEALL
jgi:hypothetical protein